MLLKKGEIRDDLLVMMRNPNFVTTAGGYGCIVEAIPSTTTAGSTPGVIYRPGDPVCYMASCSGQNGVIMDRIIYLLNKYGLKDKPVEMTDTLSEQAA